MSAAVSEAVERLTEDARMMVANYAKGDERNRIGNDLRLVLAALQEGSGALPASPSGGQWQPIDTAPRDGTTILAWCVHPHARHAEDTKEWCAPVVTQWITHNGGGWTWNGMAGTFTHWMPLPEAPSVGMEARQSRNAPQPSHSDILERIRAFDFKAHYGEAEYERLADDLEALAQPNQPRDREEG